MTVLAGVPTWVQNLGRRILNGDALSPDEQQRLSDWRERRRPPHEESVWEWREIPAKKPGKRIVQHF